MPVLGDLRILPSRAAKLFQASRRMLALVLLLLLAPVLAGCQEHYSWRQKLTVQVWTPDGLKTGSAVVQISAAIGDLFLGVGGGNSLRIKGDATVVDLGNGKYLFALVETDGKGRADYLAVRTFSKQVLGHYPGPDTEWNAFYSALEKLRATQSVPHKNYPLLVTFSNLADPQSVMEVKPENAAETLGPGFLLSSILLEITEEELTTGQVDRIIPWLDQLVGTIGRDQALPVYHFKNRIHSMSFRTK
ncbi:MAG: hypothetical protein LCH46_04855 [Proteobacteria bacterium]|nr:hypothetical protein [Pseudomonadota bacterium]